MRLPVLRRTATQVLSLMSLSGVAVAQSPIGIFDAQTDVGRPARSGSARYDPQRQTYVIAGSGQNMWGDHDDFHFVWKRMTGTSYSPLVRASSGLASHRIGKIGWTIRHRLRPTLRM